MKGGGGGINLRHVVALTARRSCPLNHEGRKAGVTKGEWVKGQEEENGSSTWRGKKKRGRLLAV